MAFLPRSHLIGILSDRRRSGKICPFGSYSTARDAFPDARGAWNKSMASWGLKHALLLALKESHTWLCVRPAADVVSAKAARSGTLECPQALQG